MKGQAMKINKSTIVKLVEKMTVLTESYTEKARDQAFEEAYCSAADVSDELKINYNGAWDLLTTARQFKKLNVKTVCRLFKAVGVEIIEDGDNT